MIEAIFLDRDGTIGGSDHAELPGVFKLSGAGKNAIAMIQKHQIPMYGFTNQPCISRGEAQKETFEKEMFAFGFDDLFLCPHTHLEGCSCRKPESGMLLQAKEKYNLNLENCVVIGDRWSDMLAGINVGCQTFLLKTGAGADALDRFKHKWDSTKVNFICEDVYEAVQVLLKEGL